MPSTRRSPRGSRSSGATSRTRCAASRRPRSSTTTTGDGMEGWRVTSRANGAQAGYSLLEVLIATAMLTVVGGLSTVALIQGNKSLSQTVTRTTVDDAAARLAQRLVSDLRQCGPSKDGDTD